MTFSRTAILLYLFTCTRAFSQSAESERISNAASAYFSAVAQGDRVGAMAAWSSKAPGRIATRERLNRTFAASRVRLVSSQPLRTVVTGDKASSRVVVDFEIVHKRSGKPTEDSGAQEKSIDWVLEDGQWKMWRYAAAETILADALIAAPGPAERARLVAQQPDLFNARLVRTLLTQAISKKDQGDFGAAVAINDVAMECALKLRDNAAMSRVKLSRGDVYLDRAERPKALAEYRVALSLSRQAKDAGREASAHCSIGVLHVSTNHYPEAKAELETCLSMARTNFSDDTETGALHNLGEMYRQMGKLADGKRLFEEELKLAVERKNVDAESMALSSLANVHAMKGEFTDALEIYKQTLAIDIEMDDKPAQAKDVGNMGSALEATGQYVAAMKALEESFERNKQLDNKQGMAAATINIGIVHQDQGQFNAAIEKFQAAYDLAGTVGDKHNQAIALNNIGSAYVLTAKYDKALVAFQSSASLERQVSNEPGAAVSEASIANVYAYTGHPDIAIATFIKVLALFRRLDMTVEEAATLQNLGEMYQARKDYVNAASYFQSSLKLKRMIPDHINEILTLNSLASLYKAIGSDARSLDSAEQAARLAREYQSAAGEATASLAIGHIQQQKHRSLQARESYRGAIEIAGQTGASGAAIAAWTGLGAVDAEQNHWQDSADHCSKAVDLVEQIRTAEVEPALRMGALSENLSPYHCVISAHLAQKRNEEAFRTAESARARSLLELLGRAKLDFEKGLTPDERKRYRALEETVNSLSTTLLQTPSKDLATRRDEARLAAGEYRRQLYKLHPDLEVHRADVPPVHLADLSPLLADGRTAFLEYVIGEDRSWLFVIKAGSPLPVVTAYPLAVKDAELQALVHNFLDNLQNKKVGPPEAWKLYQLLISPAEKDLAGIATLGIVPDRSLWQIPFSALAPRPGHFLVESWATFYAPSLTALTAMERTSAARRTARSSEHSRILLVANPSLGRARTLHIPSLGTLFELPGADREANAIAKGRDSAKKLRGLEATKSAVLSEWGSYDIVHFATHVLLDEANPMLSGIVLAQTSKQLEDGLLNAREIAVQDIGPELVVLSGCQSGAGKVYSGEGVVGLSWALFAAGAPSTLLTKWKIDDSSTAAVMPDFYNRWQTKLPGGSTASKAQALQAAQLAFLKLNPYYWAPFVLVGDWQ